METITKKINFIKKCFGENHKLSRQGKNIQVRCPVCNGSNEKLKLSICLETWVCHCWVCNTKGKTPYYIIKNNLSSGLANEYLKEFNISVGSKDDLILEDEDTIKPVDFPSKFKLLANIEKTLDPDIRDCINYLKNRGVTKDLMWRHKIGCFSGSKWSRRVVFPSFNLNHDLDFYVTRSIDDDQFFKYLNCKENKKTKLVFDEFRIDWSRELTLVEGVFDMVKCGFNTTCLLGSSLKPSHYLFKKIVENKTPILLALDADMEQKKYNIANTLSQYDIHVRILNLGDYHDIGEMPRELVKQKSLEAPNYSRENRLLNLIGTISSGSMF